MMETVNQINRSNAGLSLRVAWRHSLKRLAGVFQTVINLVAPTGYEDAAGFHSGDAPANARRPAR